MKKLFAISFLLVVSIGFLSFASADSSKPFVEDFEKYDLGDDANSVWEEMYAYEDDLEGGAKIIGDDSKVLEVSRAYLWHNTFSKVFFGKIKIVTSGNEYEWYGSRLALVNQDNPLERYEVRLYPNINKLQVNYVDRSNRTGIMSEDLENTISEPLASTDCDINLDRWYYVIVSKNGKNRWKATLLNWNRPTCKITWEDSRIKGNPAVGLQSAGKYVTSRFDEIIAK